MYAPLGFFLQNPVGELLLAFTRDQDIMDEVRATRDLGKAPNLPELCLSFILSCSKTCRPPSHATSPLCRVQNLVDSWHYLGIYGLIMLSTVITVSTTIYYFSIFAGVLIVVTFLMLWYYLPCATKLKVRGRL